ncbi:MAG: hypothetical protein JKP92_01195 [Alphaproteobacteria bacterium]|jgi:tetratricopeptide (TPR) repeat protein|nr:hypothetical protein [Alphaproteobacteria bacterium]
MTRLALVLLALLLAAPPAWAVEVRQSRGEGYTRTVFAWGERVAYEAARGPGGLEVAFNRAADLSPAPGFSVSATDPLRVLFPLAPEQEARHFRLGDRVFVDIYGDSPPVPEVRPTKEPERPLPREVPAQAPQTQDSAATKPPGTAEPASVRTQPILPHILSVAATQALTLAVFADAGTLFVLAEPPGALIEPRMIPPRGQPSALPEPKATDPPPPGARAWRLPLPPPVPRVRVRGEGMSWEIILGAGTPPQSEKPPTPGPTAGPSGGLALLWPMPGESAGRPTRLPDTRTGGADLLIVPVAGSAWRVPAVWEHPQFTVLPSAVGLVIRPKVDDLALTVTEEGVVIARPGGLALTPPGDKAARPAASPSLDAEAEKGPVLYNLSAWRGGTPEDLAPARILILAGTHDAPEAARVGGVLTLARMHLAHGRGAEALGLLRYAAALSPGLTNAPDFLAWRGAALALTRRSAAAFADLSTPALDGFPEVDYWRAFALADLGDWHQAAALLPAPPGPLPRYPEPVRTRLALALAEVSLRAGAVDEGQAFLALVQVPEEGPLAHPFGAAKAYLAGEAARQRGDARAAQEAWAPVLAGADTLYRVKATLAATRLLREEGVLSSGQAIDQLERVRYLWRGDGLEAQILLALGGLYCDQSQYAKGLTLMRRAAAIAAHTDLGQEIVAEMEARFTGLFGNKERLAALPPPEAAALYEAFGELVPAGPEGDALTADLAGHLIDAGLLDQGAALLAGQVDRGAAGETARRLAAVYLMADKPAEALVVLDGADCGGAQTCAREVALLRAKALSQQGRPSEALASLASLPDGGQGEDAARARVDIAWRSQDWASAAGALDDLLRALSAQPIPGPEPPAPAPETANLVLRRAVALRLSGEEGRRELAQWRASWGPAMAGTEEGPAFGVVTDPGVLPGSGSVPGPSPAEDARLWQETLQGADLFSTFLERYKKRQPPPPP